ncbi:23S rRNA (adenine(2030)-N(6))-methyltransferase RlmJ [Rhizobiaceae bacterium n13]|uniref:Ribosomal RNA large subunit methyltransferase J n=1 Tax=Ferirhizobium litorale TaxID=2927786 RepID=A0AAE3TZP2_9HYPH|nr:23S rRNA (adenine(2030)-N(6))-methyltransferase RlmJ [Fererhizobium litorale]MDI7861057.1 23S rRNA (adenine(2030)-N(6))-methyltransferase RlmJ [Fererhizobium litorale]MDI7921204.1 23S rRNA (adenine(2030)-N(6))-methyltransferase RlmJ [Fererhizobium litorale]
MNYRHIYHAGNFADVLKHAVLARLIRYAQQKDAAFRLLDTHAGIGLYDLSSEEAQKTGEWQGGIGKLMDAELPTAVGSILEPYLTAVRELNPEGGITYYPGSPKLARMLFRPQDRLSAMELHPDDFAALRRQFESDFQVRVTELDGWLSLGAHLPPKEKRGIVLVDPPFELEGEYERLADGFAKAYRRFSTGVYCLWYPIKKGAPIAAFHETLKGLDIKKMLCAELSVKSDRNTTGLTGSGLIIVNPPYTLKDELHTLLPFLKDLLAEDRYASQRAFWLRGEN